MCELLAVAAERPVPIGPILNWARRVEVMGLAGYGWGAAWTCSDHLSAYKYPGSLAGDLAGAARLEQVIAERVLIHLRRPSDPSTVTMADTQPFVDDAGSFAFCHNGFFKQANSFRKELSDRLLGRADSEVGFRWLERAIGAGTAPMESLVEMHRVMTGTANCGYLGRHGELIIYHSNEGNPAWRFKKDGMDVLVTGLHWPGNWGLRLAFPGVEPAYTIEEGATVLLGLPS